MGLDKTSKSPRKTRNKVIRISFASLKLPTLQFIKHILGPREPITESLARTAVDWTYVSGVLKSETN
jgi:hypothetical protein